MSDHACKHGIERCERCEAMRDAKPDVAFNWFNPDSDGTVLDDNEIASALEADDLVADFVADTRVLLAERKKWHERAEHEGTAYQRIVDNSELQTTERAVLIAALENADEALEQTQADIANFQRKLKDEQAAWEAIERARAAIAKAKITPSACPANDALQFERDEAAKWKALAAEAKRERDEARSRHDTLRAEFDTLRHSSDFMRLELDAERERAKGAMALLISIGKMLGCRDSKDSKATLEHLTICLPDLASEFVGECRALNEKAANCPACSSDEG